MQKKRPFNSAAISSKVWPYKLSHCNFIITRTQNIKEKMFYRNANNSHLFCEHLSS